MSLNAQVKLNDSGFGDVQLGKNIKAIKGVSHFSSFPDRNLFQVFPSDIGLYVWQSQDSLIGGTQLRYVFLSADSNGIVIKISLWINDLGRKVESYLNRIYGKPKYKAEPAVNGWRNRGSVIWELSPDISAFLAQPFVVDPTLGFEVTKLEFFYPHNLKKISKHIIAPRF
ncbi:hypothetical protein [Chitinophaga niabensis]|uniref:Uncharacterized protein n=1 Tax=Chitinophaga niabensis TaxID=536979 RepID=A0A1N6E3N3_9BACT|nr:hypothetical protein [Chitinophaga niabensis]SIN77650.1 hypothetical protein SAMN04488055_1280 [Chitinophaga niabensis]